MKKLPETNSLDTRSYWLLLCAVEEACLRGEKPEHGRRGTQGQCMGCWQEMIQHVQRDTKDLIMAVIKEVRSS